MDHMGLVVVRFCVDSQGLSCGILGPRELATCTSHTVCLWKMLSKVWYPTPNQRKLPTKNDLVQL